MPEEVMCRKDKTAISESLLLFGKYVMPCEHHCQRIQEKEKNVRLVQNLLRSPHRCSKVTKPGANLPSISVSLVL